MRWVILIGVFVSVSSCSSGDSYNSRGYVISKSPVEVEPPETAVADESQELTHGEPVD